MEATITEEVVEMVNLKMMKKEAIWLLGFMRNLSFICAAKIPDDDDKERELLCLELLRIFPKLKHQLNANNEISKIN